MPNDERRNYSGKGGRDVPADPRYRDAIATLTEAEITAEMDVVRADYEKALKGGADVTDLVNDEAKIRAMAEGRLADRIVRGPATMDKPRTDNLTGVADTTDEPDFNV
ncbi:MAG: hypothetical protein FWC00_00880 [Firmicutes bacterium]|nr:hypothetical protein [Bacillota bacterium]